jgi:hypothetical protein
MPGTSPWIRRMALALALAGVVGLALIALRLREQHRRALTDAWLFCIECDHGELSAVVRMRDAAVRHLAGPLLRGRGTRRHASMEARIRATYSPDSALSEDAYVDLMMADYLAGYQERAITGLRVLADSGIRSAAEALRAALDSVDTGRHQRPTGVERIGGVRRHGDRPPAGRPGLGHRVAGSRPPGQSVPG